MSIPLDRICQHLAELAPLALAESWDNVGLLVGDRSRSVQRVMTCLTVTPDAAAEAVDQKADLIVAHHPIPFRPLKRLTSDSMTGSVLLSLLSSGVAVYSAHTAFDSAPGGINQQWAESLSLGDIQAIQSPDDGQPLGSGRYGKLPKSMSASELIQKCGKTVGATRLRAAGDASQMIQTVGFACGSGGSFVSAAHRAGCDLLITGEATFHDCLAAESLGMVLGMLGHYHSERFAMENLASDLQAKFETLTVWASQNETDPVRDLR